MLEHLLSLQTKIKYTFIVSFLLLLFFSDTAIAQCWENIGKGAFHTLGVYTDGTLRAWGQNTYGQLGNASPGNDEHVPIQVGNDSDWVMADGGYSHTVAIKTDGTLWAWGLNFHGQLGDGTNDNRDVPVQIGSDTNWEYVAAGNFFNMAIKSDGSLWAWGINDHGQLGDNTNDSRNAPAQVGSATNWKSVAVAPLHVIALQENGSLWAWGINNYGHFGDGTTDSQIVPTQVTGSSDWDKISASLDHTLALKTNGTLWAWGRNDKGQLGNGTSGTALVLSPIQIGAATDWKEINTYYYHNMALKNDNSLWVWGSNSHGQLGDGTFDNILSPTAFDGNTNWKTASLGAYNSFIINDDNDMWAWGRNDFGQIGNGSIDDQPNPVVIECEALGVEDISVIETISLYPNPTTDFVFIENPKELFIGSITIRDLSGRIVAIHQPEESHFSVATLPAGMYLLQVNVDSDTLSFKLLKQ